MEKGMAGVTTLPPHKWTKGRDEDTRGLYTSPENTGGTAGDGRPRQHRTPGLGPCGHRAAGTLGPSHTQHVGVPAASC